MNSILKTESPVAPALKPYPTYKPSDIERLGEVPVHWEVRRLRNVARVAFSNVDKHSRKYENSVRLCNYTDVYYNDRICSNMNFMVSTATTEEIDRYRLFAGDVLITKDSESWDDIGVPSLVECADSDMVCGYHLALLRPASNELSSKFLHRLLSARSVAIQLFVRANGVTRFGLSQSAVKSISLPLPPLLEQNTIANFLDHFTDRIEQYIRSKEKLITLLEEQRQIIAQQAVTGRFDVRVGNPYPAYRPSGTEWLGDIPAHWKVRRNGQIFAQRNETGHPELPILEVSLHSGVSVREFCASNRKQVMSDREMYKRALKGDIAYNMMRMWQGAAGVAPVDGLVSPAYVVAKPLAGNDSRYFNHLFHIRPYMTEVNRYSRGIVKDRNRLYWEDFKQIQTPCPPLDEQVLIANAIDDTVRLTADGVRNLQRQIGMIKEYRARLIADVVTGKLDVREAAAHLAETAEGLTEGEDKSDTVED